MTTIKTTKYRIDYFFNHSTMGFSNSVTVMASDETQATQLAKQAVADTYGMIWKGQLEKRFTYNKPYLIN